MITTRHIFDAKSVIRFLFSLMAMATAIDSVEAGSCLQEHRHRRWGTCLFRDDVHISFDEDIDHVYMLNPCEALTALELL